MREIHKLLKLNVVTTSSDIKPRIPQRDGQSFILEILSTSGSRLCVAPALSKGALSPNEKGHHIEREGDEPGERKSKKYSGISTSAIKAGAEGGGLHDSPCHKEGDEAGSRNARKQQHDIGKQSHVGGVWIRIRRLCGHQRRSWCGSDIFLLNASYFSAQWRKAALRNALTVRVAASLAEE
ncbi:hypothetical protein [Agrobacterium cavarae]|uniref:hypothetical protein n=1 Tax=Agrobacterium TaxID=357 RepID=UPI002FFA0B3E